MIASNLLFHIVNLDVVVSLWRENDPESELDTPRYVCQYHRRHSATPWVRRRRYGDSEQDVLQQVLDDVRASLRQAQEGRE